MIWYGYFIGYVISYFIMKDCLQTPSAKHNEGQSEESCRNWTSGDRAITLTLALFWPFMVPFMWCTCKINWNKSVKW